MDSSSRDEKLLFLVRFAGQRFWLEASQRRPAHCGQLNRFDLYRASQRGSPPAAKKGHGLTWEQRYRRHATSISAHRERWEYAPGKRILHAVPGCERGPV